MKRSPASTPPLPEGSAFEPLRGPWADCFEPDPDGRFRSFDSVAEIPDLASSLRAAAAFDPGFVSAVCDALFDRPSELLNAASFWLADPASAPSAQTFLDRNAASILEILSRHWGVGMAASERQIPAAAHVFRACLAAEPPRPFDPRAHARTLWRCLLLAPQPAFDRIRLGDDDALACPRVSFPDLHSVWTSAYERHCADRGANPLLRMAEIFPRIPDSAREAAVAAHAATLAAFGAEFLVLHPGSALDSAKWASPSRSGAFLSASVKWASAADSAGAVGVSVFGGALFVCADGAEFQDDAFALEDLVDAAGPAATPAEAGAFLSACDGKINNIASARAFAAFSSEATSCANLLRAFFVLARDESLRPALGISPDGAIGPAASALALASCLPTASAGVGDAFPDESVAALLLCGCAAVSRTVAANTLLSQADTQAALLRGASAYLSCALEGLGDRAETIAALFDRKSVESRPPGPWKFVFPDLAGDLLREQRRAQILAQTPKGAPTPAPRL